jgi:amidase
MTRPDKDELIALADRIGWFRLGNDEADEYAELADAVLDVLDLVDGAPLPGYARPTPRDAGPRPYTPRTDADDPLNAIVGWTDIASGDSGILDGLRLAIKDSVSIAGVPMTLGSAAVQGYAPRVDSVVVDRILAQGGRIVATTNMDDFAFSGGGETSAFGPIRNPHDHSRAAGGSSSGSAAALSYRDRIDAAIGTDQGGSIRVPAAWCGALGLKPTHGVVPYTDIAGIDPTFDHAGPMATSVDVLGRLFLAIAGPDASDPRQRGVEFDSDPVRAALESTSTDFTGVRVGVVVEGFSEDDPARAATAAAVRAVSDQLRADGAHVEDVSVPEHLLGGGVAFAGFIEGMSATALGGGNGFGWQGRYNPELAAALHEAFHRHGQLLSAQIKLVALLGEHLRRTTSGAGYASAQNQRSWLRAAYDKALARYDVLLMPTVPYVAHEIEPELGLAARALKGWAALANCTPLNMTGHPALSLPAAAADGLPVGVMLIGSHGSDGRLIDLAGRYERRHGWVGLPD